MRRLNKFQVEKRYSVLIFVYAVIIFALSICHIGNIYQLYVLHDEFGYWLNAAHFAGYDWSGISSISPYYSYGYSIILTPLFWIFKDSVMMYRAAIVINVLLYVGSFFLSLKCAERLFTRQDKYVSATMCFITALYCNNLLQVNMAWTESLLYFWFWLLLFTLLCFLKSQKLQYAVCFVVELIYLYIIHQRTLGVVLAGFATLLLMMLLKQKRNWKKIFAVVGVLIAGFVLVVAVKGYLQNNLWMWENEALADQNDYSGQIWKLKYILTSWEGMLEMLTSFGGKILYLLISSAGLVFWAVVSGIRRILHKDNNRKKYAYVFVSMSLLFTVGISAIMMVKGGRIDCVIYGRYSEFLMGPLLLIGMQYLYRHRISVRQFAVFLLVFSLCGLGVKFALETRETFTYIQSVGAGLFYDRATGDFALSKYLLFGLLLATAVFCAAYWKRKALYVIAGTLMIGYWGMSCQTALKAEVLSGQECIKNVSYITDAMDSVGEAKPIYFVQAHQGGYFNWRIENIQFLMREKKIELVTYDEVANLTGEYYLIQYGIDDLDMSRYEVVMQAYGMVLMVPRDTALAERWLAYNREYPYVFTDTMMYSETQTKEFTFDTDYKNGFVTFCQDLTLSPGTYQVSMELEIEEYTDDVLGTYDVSYDYGQQIICSGELRASEMDEDGKLHVLYEFSCQDTIRHAELRAYSYGNSVMRLEKISYRRLE